MKTVYLFSGLGADKRVFQYVDLSKYNTIFINWNLPLKDDSIEVYAIKLLEQIQHKNPIFIGVSFGGIMAVEVAKLIETEKIILISSAKTKNEIPFYYKYAGKINAHKLLPTSLLQNFNFIADFLFGVSNKEEKKLLNDIIKDTNPTFLKWAIDKIVSWQNIQIPNNLIHIHGNADKILPIKFIKSSIIINKGCHFMIVSESSKINKIIHELIN